MNNLSKRERVDELIDHFWKNGYLTLYRKHGTFLPEPKPVGGYNIDAVGKYKQKLVMGVILSADDLNDPKISARLNFLATRHTKFSNRRVTLFVGVPADYYSKARMIVTALDEDAKKNIKLVKISKPE